MGGSFFVGNGEGIEALAKPIFVRGVSPFNGSGTAVTFNGCDPSVGGPPSMEPMRLFVPHEALLLEVRFLLEF